MLFITRRCHRRRFALAPGDLVNGVFLYLLAVAVALYGVQVCAICVQSNHYHIVLYDPTGVFPKFLQWLNSLSARAINAGRGDRDAFWSSEPPHVAVLADADAVIEKIAYTLANPVRAGAVPQGRYWPGLRTRPNEYGSQRRIRRPAVFFDVDGSLPDVATFQVHVPPTHAHLSPAEFGKLVANRVGEVEAEARAERNRLDLGFMGRSACLAVDPEHRADTPEHRGTDSRPDDVVATDPVSRREARKNRRGFLDAYRTALKAWMGGDHTVTWPTGTWHMLRIHAGRAAAPP